MELTYEANWTDWLPVVPLGHLITHKYNHHGRNDYILELQSDGSQGIG